ncbi:MULTISPECIES: TadE/TadG family type IV pilus assembly protein [Isoptericola]|uniref:TadE/TadG family type IV pilus assembly protein n=1 Tax=Isoptericola TaxID=254250 RepID=UPI0027139F37|nr:MULTISPECIES: TadE/TadG family type IV pilus assembly protein [unclassified Isoptericola]MDO8144380.1 TadE/TadG family type IV pilus assembly protein [Isoptericola sp. 178]MDO8148234.1 TadE/TadG family type IV pilus assembly protein [Isoptericola sp. b515]MDO8151715.1 TadE/TadG family type IV pilus assembly protein [Isoptericola sp. b408]
MAEFALVSALLVALFLGVVQVALALHVRAVAIDAAAEGARLAARTDHDLGAGAQRTRDLLASALSERYAGDVVVGTTRRGGLDLVRVTVTAPLPVVGLLGPSGAMTVEGHAVDESA